jgi:hypothetical protein
MRKQRAGECEKSMGVDEAESEDGAGTTSGEKRDSSLRSE